MIVVALLLAAAAPGAKPAPIKAGDPMLVDFDFDRLSRNADGTLADHGDWLYSFDRYVTADQLPAALRKAEGKGSVVIGFRQSAAGASGPCAVVEGDPAIGAELCTLITTRVPIPVAYDAPGHSVDLDWLLRLKWTSERKSVRDERMRNASRMMMPRPPAPPMIGGWPPTYVSTALIVDAVPPIGNYLPVGRKADRSGKAAVVVTFEPQSASPRCDIARSSGTTAVDMAACRWASDLRVRYRHLCIACGPDTLPLWVEFDGRKSRVRQPSNDARHWPQRVAIAGLSQKDSQHLMSLPKTSRQIYTRVTVGANALPVRCIIFKSSGNAEVDDAICGLLMRSRYAAATDVFGDAMISDLSVPITFE